MDTILAQEGRTGSSESRKKKVFQYTIEGELVHIWKSAVDANSQIGIPSSGISSCCTGVCKTCMDYVWSYSELEKDYFENINKSHCKRIKQYARDGTYIRTYDSVLEASKCTGIKYQTITNNCHNNGAYITKNKYRWVFDGEELNIIKDTYTNKKEIEQYSLDGNFIKTWESAREVEKTIGINHSHIAACCRGRYKTSGGYIWKYKQEN